MGAWSRRGHCAKQGLEEGGKQGEAGGRTENCKEGSSRFRVLAGHGTWLRLRKGLLLNKESRRLLFVVVVGRVRVDKVAKGHGYLKAAKISKAMEKR